MSAINTLGRVVDARKVGKIRRFVISLAVIKTVVKNPKENEKKNNNNKKNHTHTHANNKFNSPPELTIILIWSGHL